MTVGSEVHSLAERFASFRKSDRVKIFNAALESKTEVLQALRLFMRKNANTLYVETYRVEIVGEWLSTNLPELLKNFRRIITDLETLAEDKINPNNPAPWKNPAIFDHFKHGLEVGARTAANSSALEGTQKKIRFEVVDP